MKLYVATPIALFKGDITAARDHAEGACEELRRCNFEAVNPMDIPPDCGRKCTGPKERPDDFHARTCYLRYDIIAMLQCDGVALNDGWEQSEGAVEERRIALHCGLPVKTIDQWLARAEFDVEEI